MNNSDTIVPGNVYMYRCDNNQGYGYMIPVKTSDGWDFIDTYQLDIPSQKSEETSDNASVRRIIELGHGEHDGYVSRASGSFYHRNAYFGKDNVPVGLELRFNLNDYNVVSYRECDDYNTCDVVRYVPLYHEQHYDWDWGKTLGLCFVRKNANKNPVNEFRSLVQEASRSIVEPYVAQAASLLDKVNEKLSELEDTGLLTERDKTTAYRLAKRIEIIVKCTEDLRNVGK